MAIEISPRPKPKSSSFSSVLLFIILLLCLASVAAYFAFNFYGKKMENELVQLQKDLEKSESEKALEEEIFGSATVVGYQQKIEDFSFLLAAHRLPVNLFNFFEANTHPKVWFSKFNLDLEKNLLAVSGYADSFEILGQQTLILNQQDFIENINLSRVSLTKDGKINFDILLIIDPKIFK